MEGFLVLGAFEFGVFGVRQGLRLAGFRRPMRLVRMKPVLRISILSTLASAVWFARCAM